MFIPLKTIAVTEKNYKIFGFVFASIGGVFLLLTAISFFSAKNKSETYTRAEGFVTAVQECPNNEPNENKTVMYSISFYEGKGKKVDFATKICEYPPRYDVGQKINVIYPKENPQAAEILDNPFLFFYVMLWGILSFVFLNIAVFAFATAGTPIKGPNAALVIIVYCILAGFFIIFVGSDMWLNKPTVKWYAVIPMVIGLLALRQTKQS